MIKKWKIVLTSLVILTMSGTIAAGIYSFAIPAINVSKGDIGSEKEKDPTTGTTDPNPNPGGGTTDPTTPTVPVTELERDPTSSYSHTPINAYEVSNFMKTVRSVSVFQNANKSDKVLDILASDLTSSTGFDRNNSTDFYVYKTSDGTITTKVDTNAAIRIVLNYNSRTDTLIVKEVAFKDKNNNFPNTNDGSGKVTLDNFTTVDSINNIYSFNFSQAYDKAQLYGRTRDITVGLASGANANTATIKRVKIVDGFQTVSTKFDATKTDGTTKTVDLSCSITTADNTDDTTSNITGQCFFEKETTTDYSNYAMNSIAFVNGYFSNTGQDYSFFVVGGNNSVGRPDDPINLKGKSIGTAYSVTQSNRVSLLNRDSSAYVALANRNNYINGTVDEGNYSVPTVLMDVVTARTGSGNTYGLGVAKPKVAFQGPKDTTTTDPNDRISIDYRLAPNEIFQTKLLLDKVSSDRAMEHFVDGNKKVLVWMGGELDINNETDPEIYYDSMATTLSSMRDIVGDDTLIIVGDYLLRWRNNVRTIRVNGEPTSDLFYWRDKLKALAVNMPNTIFASSDAVIGKNGARVVEGGEIEGSKILYGAHQMQPYSNEIVKNMYDYNDQAGENSFGIYPILKQSKSSEYSSTYNNLDETWFKALRYGDETSNSFSRLGEVWKYKKDGTYTFRYTATNTEGRTVIMTFKQNINPLGIFVDDLTNEKSNIEIVSVYDSDKKITIDNVDFKGLGIDTNNNECFIHGRVDSNSGQGFCLTSGTQTNSGTIKSFVTKDGTLFKANEVKLEAIVN